jgi:hypothetical protein
MISERQLSMNYSSFWRGIAPLADAYWRAQNLQVERFAEPLHTKRERQSRGFVNELAFESFVRVLADGNKIDGGAFRKAAESAKESVANYISRFTQIDNKILLRDFSSELPEVVAIAERLDKFFSPSLEMGSNAFRPKFSGCGLLMAAEGDVLVDETLFEVKAGDRNFRVSDLRQLLVYCALNHKKPIANITRIALVNPRIGISWSSDLESCSRAISGRSSAELLDDIVDFVIQPQSYE